MSEATAPLRPGRYRHYKGNQYEVIAVARHSETEEEVSAEGRAVPRFQWIGEI